MLNSSEQTWTNRKRYPYPYPGYFVGLSTPPWSQKNENSKKEHLFHSYSIIQSNWDIELSNCDIISFQHKFDRSIINHEVINVHVFRNPECKFFLNLLNLISSNLKVFFPNKVLHINLDIHLKTSADIEFDIELDIGLGSGLRMGWTFPEQTFITKKHWMKS
jgi:hypothetical protein